MCCIFFIYREGKIFFFKIMIIMYVYDDDGRKILYSFYYFFFCFEFLLSCNVEIIVCVIDFDVVLCMF